MGKSILRISCNGARVEEGFWIPGLLSVRGRGFLHAASKTYDHVKGPGIPCVGILDGTCNAQYGVLGNHLHLFCEYEVSQVPAFWEITRNKNLRLQAKCEWQESYPQNPAYSLTVLRELRHAATRSGRTLSYPIWILTRPNNMSKGHLVLHEIILKYYVCQRWCPFIVN